MNALEKACREIRHSKLLKKAGWLWHTARPIYNAVVNAAGSQGLERVINGTDRILIHPHFRNMCESYEPDVWARVMAEVRPDDHVVDVGAHIGLYTLALAGRVRPGGTVTAFEPDPDTFQWLRRHIQLNGLKDRIRAVNAAVGSENGTAYFSGDRDCQNQIMPEGVDGARQVPVVTLDSEFENHRIGILKIDVEGFEEGVLVGAEALLSHPTQAPRSLFIEVHPYNWHLCGTSSGSLLDRLRRHGYKVEQPDGTPVDHISVYGEIVAMRTG